MSKLTFAHLDLTGLNESVVLSRAIALQEQMEARFGRDAFPGREYPLQQAVDAVTDAAIEANQGAHQ